MSEILTGGPLKFTEPNCPTRVGEYIKTLGNIYGIPNPRLGMQVFVEDQKRTYIVTELKSKTINGVVVPNAQVGKFELLGEKSVAWGASSNMNSFTRAGVYNIKGERTNANDNLPISNSNPGHTISGRLIVLDSSIDGTGNSKDKCITQLLTLSNRTGEDGNTYIRTASGASLDSLTWKSWATQQTNVNVGQVTSLDSFIDNGIYSGVFVESGVPSTFVMIVINDYFVGVSPRRVSQFLYKLSKTGEVSYTTRLGVGDGTITWNGWEIINKKELDTTATELLKRIQGTSANSSASYDPFKRYPTNFSSVADAEFMEALNTMHSTDSTSGVDGFWRLYIGRLAVEVKNVAIKYVDDTWVQTIKLPYKWYKSSNKFGIDDDGNHHIHSYYRIHKDGSWGEWIEVEEELKSAITAEENRAKAEEAAIRKLITDLIGESPETLDSIHEISSWILNDQTGAAAMAKAVSENKTAIEAEVERATEVENTLASNISNETSARLNSDNDIKNKAALFGMFEAKPNTNGIDITYQNLNQNVNGTINIPAATIEKAGVMTANDKTKIETGFVGTTQTSEQIKLNSYTQEGMFNFINVTLDNGSPISGNGVVSGRLTVFVTNNNDNKIVTQVLNLNNNESGEGNIYIRSFQNIEWKPWAKFQTNIDVGIIDSSQLDNLIDSGIYSGIIEGTGETFIIICINNYTVAQEIHNIAQLKYSLVLTHEVKIEKRIRNVDNSWSEWESVGSGSTLPEATVDKLGGVKLGTTKFTGNKVYIPINNINIGYGSGLGFRIDSEYFINEGDVLKINSNNTLKIDSSQFGVALGTITEYKNVIPCVLGSNITGNIINEMNDFAVGIPYNIDQFTLKRNGLNLKDDISSGVTKITWDANSNMNDFKTPGVYEIYGERTVDTDNLPITNTGSGHSIAARLTVVASTLQPTNNEICVTQFLQLSNRVGGEGTIYVRTYNENNNGMNGWSAWQKQMGMVETLINSDDATVGQEIFSTTAQKIGDGLNGMIDNGVYSGIYIDNLSYTGTGSLYYLSAQPTFVETFALIVINDYAASGKLGMQRHITQLKYAVDAINGQSTVKKRVGTGNDTISWDDWEDIGGGGLQEVDITDAVKTYGLPTFVVQGFAKEGVTYVVNCELNSIPVLEPYDGQKIKNFLLNKIDSYLHSNTKVIFKIIKFKCNETLFIDCFIDYLAGYYYKFIINEIGAVGYQVKVSADMTEL